MTSAISSRYRAWQALIEQPLSFVKPQSLRQGWPPTMTETQHAAIAAAPRFLDRRVALLLNYFDLQPAGQLPAPHEQDLPVLLLDPGVFEQLPRRCGAIWHASTLSQEIRSDVVNALQALLGKDVLSVALANRSLAGAVDLLRRPNELARAIDQDGISLVAAWLDHQPAPLRKWLNLRFNLSPVENGTVAGDLVLDVVRCAAATFHSPAEESFA